MKLWEIKKINKLQEVPAVYKIVKWEIWVLIARNAASDQLFQRTDLPHKGLVSSLASSEKMQWTSEPAHSNCAKNLFHRRKYFFLASTTLPLYTTFLRRILYLWRSVSQLFSVDTASNPSWSTEQHSKLVAFFVLCLRSAAHSLVYWREVHGRACKFN